MDDSDDDDNCYYGTPLEELDEDDARQTKAPRVEDQVVCDKQGRRRFHGAFTGGFSAGYFNSVGTKEGWTPSTFVSSRNQRMGAKQAKPQDFMDDEDLEAHGISPQGIQATSSFDDSENKKRKRVLDPTGPIPGIPVLEEILKPNKETMGMKLLRKLGWKPGQGIGPRVKMRQKKLAQKEAKKIYGCQLPQENRDESDEDVDGDDYSQDVTFAPDDVETIYLSKPKSDQFGLGYKPLDRTPVLGGHINLFDPSPLAMTEKKKKLLIKGQAFGVGAFEEEDEDIYAVEDMSNYDFGEEKTSAKGPQQQEKSHMAMMGLIEMIDGFSLSSQRNYAPKVYPKPKISGNFVPKHKPRRRRFELKDSEKQGLGRHELTSELRARIIANRPQATVEYRTGLKGQASEPPPKNSTQKSLDTSEVDKIFEEFKNSEAKLRTDFKPFAKNTEKQKRYELYLKMKDKGQKDRYYLAQPKTMTEWERTQEIHGFERAAKLFRPLASTMATRFVSAVTEDCGQGLKEGLNLDVPKQAEKSSSPELDTLGHDVADDRVKAAKMNMFGKLTQTVVDWYPDRVLCRRFNVPHPYPESNFVGVRKSKREKFSIFSFLEGPPRGGEKFQEDPTEEVPLPEPSSLTTQLDENPEEEKEEPETYGLKVPVDGPPTMDLFKAIFQDSDSESEEDSSAGKEKESENVQQETDILGKSPVDQEDSIKKERESSESETDDQRSRNIKSSLDSFLSDMRKGKTENMASEKEATNTSDIHHKKRVSRFEPKKDDSEGVYENIPKPVFMPRKKTQPAEEAAPAKGIFANIDFELLNSYRTSGPVENKDDDKNEEHSPPSVQKVVEECHKVSSDSSIDSEDEYGPPVPAHLKNRQQMIKSPPSSVSQLIANRKPFSKEESLWVVKDEKRKSHKKHKHEDKHKSKKEKKKKKHKERKHKKKSSKKHRRKSDSSSCDSSED